MNSATKEQLFNLYDRNEYPDFPAILDTYFENIKFNSFTGVEENEITVVFKFDKKTLKKIKPIFDNVEYKTREKFIISKCHNMIKWHPNIPRNSIVIRRNCNDNNKFEVKFKNSYPLYSFNDSTEEEFKHCNIIKKITYGHNIEIEIPQFNDWCWLQHYGDTHSSKYIYCDIEFDYFTFKNVRLELRHNNTVKFEYELSDELSQDDEFKTNLKNKYIYDLINYVVENIFNIS